MSSRLGHDSHGRFTGTATGRAPFSIETPRRTGTHRDSPRKWTEDERAEARRLAGEGISQAKIAERVCGDRRFRSTVQLWLRAQTVPKPSGTSPAGQAVPVA